MPSRTIAMTQNPENKRMENHTFHAAGVMTVVGAAGPFNPWPNPLIYIGACGSLDPAGELATPTDQHIRGSTQLQRPADWHLSQSLSPRTFAVISGLQPADWPMTQPGAILRLLLDNWLWLYQRGLQAKNLGNSRFRFAAAAV